MHAYKMTNLARGVLVIPDLNGMNHINIPVGGSKTLTAREYFYYQKNAETRSRNKLLKIELVQGTELIVKDDEFSEPEDQEVSLAAEVEDQDDEFTPSEDVDSNESEPEEDLAGIDEDEGEEETVQPVVVKKKKKKKKKKSKTANQ